MIYHTDPTRPTKSSVSSASSLISAEQPGKVATYFRQVCATCCGLLQIRVENMGQRVLCPHCGHEFTAVDLATDAPADDCALQQRVMRFLRSRRIEGLEAVRAEVNGHTVILRGRVTTAHARWLCTSCAARVGGVQRVVDELEIGDARGAMRHMG